jgi:hypothetical protein
MVWLRAVAAVLGGFVLGIALWAVGEVVLHGVCSVPVLKVLWCTYAPGPLGSVGRDLDIFDLLALPFVVIAVTAELWRRWVRPG